jgi:hypothetical protein
MSPLNGSPVYDMNPRNVGWYGALWPKCHLPALVRAVEIDCERELVRVRVCVCVCVCVSLTYHVAVVPSSCEYVCDRQLPQRHPVL